MVIEKDRYTYRVMWSEEDEEYVGLCAEFPSLNWLAESPCQCEVGTLIWVCRSFVDAPDYKSFQNFCSLPCQ